MGIWNPVPYIDQTGHWLQKWASLIKHFNSSWPILELPKDNMVYLVSMLDPYSEERNERTRVYPDSYAVFLKKTLSQLKYPEQIPIPTCAVLSPWITTLCQLYWYSS